MKYELILSLLIVSLIISVFLSVKPVSEICSPEQGCNTVLTSKYSQILGIKNNYLGVLGFLILTIATISFIIKKNQFKKKIIILGITIWLIGSLILLSIQIFVLHAICKYCIIVDASGIISFISIIIKEKN